MIESGRQGDDVPTPEERRRAVCDAMAIAPGLIRFASRFTQSIHDAEDAYQRAMEIALTKAPVTDRERFLAWLRTVLKHEALAIANDQARETPGSEGDLAEASLPARGPAPDAVAEWRGRYRAIQEAMGQLTDSQRVCLLLQSSGASYARIAEITGFSTRKVERSVVEGRSRLRAWEIRIAAGEACQRIDEAIERAACRGAGRADQRAVRRHVRHCSGCRALLASRRRRAEGFSALVPGALIVQPLATASPDPGPYLAAWDRALGGLTVRTGQLMQFGLELPGTTLGRVAAGAGALVLAVFTAVPLASDLIDNGSEPRAEPVAISEERRASAAMPTTSRPAASRPSPLETEPSDPTSAADPGARPPVRSRPDPVLEPTPKPKTPEPTTSEPTRTPKTQAAVTTPARTTISPPPAAAVASASTPPPAPPPEPAAAPVPAAPSPPPAPLEASDVVIPDEAATAGPDGAVIYGD